jgi:hypothetical protein
MYVVHTLVVSLIVMSWSASPFGVLVYSMLAGDATNITDWAVYTTILLVQQIAYGAIKAIKSE